MSIWDEIRSAFRHGTSLTKLLFINGTLFLILKILEMVFYLAGNPGFSVEILPYLAVPAYLPALTNHFWTPVSYMFLHQGFFHLLFNMLVLYWFGRIFLEYLDQRKLVALYLLGGLSGAIIYIACFNLLPVFSDMLVSSVAIGASASVMAIMTAIAVWIPEYQVLLFLIGRIRLKYLALIMFLLTSVLDFSVNTGGKIAHIGGAAFGVIYALSLKKGTDLGKGINALIDLVVTSLKPRSKTRVIRNKTPKNDSDYNMMKAAKQAEINRILDKVSKGGYDSLTKEEKKKLFSESQNNR